MSDIETVEDLLIDQKIAHNDTEWTKDEPFSFTDKDGVRRQIPCRKTMPAIEIKNMNGFGTVTIYFNDAGELVGFEGEND